MIILYVIVAAVVLILIIVIIQTVITSHRRIVTPFKQPVDENLETAEKLSKAIQYRTESFNNLARINRDEYRRFHEFLNTSFPLVHEQLERRELSDFSVLYRWEGTNTELEPALLMAHWDVVPVPEEEEAQWNEPPFSGAIKDGFIHGRGSLDDKISLISILQGVETLLAEGYRPGRTVYVAFGGDEEIGGLNGAANTVRYLEKEGIRLSWVLDEATVIIQGGLLGIERPIALIGISEKGQADIRVTASGDSGHASMPPKSTAAGVLAKAIWRIEKRPSRLTLTPLMKGFLESLAPCSKAVRLKTCSPRPHGPLPTVGLSPVIQYRIPSTGCVKPQGGKILQSRFSGVNIPAIPYPLHRWKAMGSD